MKTLDRLLDELQEKLGGWYAGMHQLDEAARQQREETIQRGLNKIIDILTPEFLEPELGVRIEELNPKVKLVQNREYGSAASVPDVNERNLLRYGLLQKLRGMVKARLSGNPIVPT